MILYVKFLFFFVLIHRQKKKQLVNSPIASFLFYSDYIVNLFVQIFLTVSYNDSLIISTHLYAVQVIGGVICCFSSSDNLQTVTHCANEFHLIYITVGTIDRKAENLIASLQVLAEVSCYSLVCIPVVAASLRNIHFA